MEAVAKLKYARISAQKLRFVANEIRGVGVLNAMNNLKHTQKKAARMLEKLLISAIANAENNFNMDLDALRVSKIFVDQGPVFKRLMPRAKGRANRIEKKTSHVTLILKEDINKREL